MIKIQDTSTATPARVAREEAAVLKARLLRDIGAKWERFSEDDLALLSHLCPSGSDYGMLLRRTLDILAQEQAA